VDRDEFKQHFSKAVPLLRAGGQHKKILLTPLIRYAIQICCENTEHRSNRGPALNKLIYEKKPELENLVRQSL
jgi:hypothetical protein